MESTIKFRVKATFKESFEKAIKKIGDKTMSYHLRKEMQRIIDKANKITHA